MPSEKKNPTPKWLKSRARARMAETGEKYTQALRRIKEELGYVDPHAR